MTLVSAIVPAFHRPRLCVDAVRSILAQRLPTGTQIEAIVVLDGPQPATKDAIERIDDERVRTVQLPTNRGHAAARAEGIRVAKGSWCAFLDDDDLWMPDKISLQLETARASDAPLPVVGCRLEARLGRGSLIWPENEPTPSEHIADYLYARRSLASLRSGHGLIQTSMILAPTDLMRRVPFRPGMRRHADPDWIVRAAQEPGVGFVFPETDTPLAVWNLHDGSRVSGAAAGSGDWRYSIAWARRHRSMMTPASIAGFLTGPAAHRAATLTRGLTRVRAFAALARSAIALGQPSIYDAAALLLTFLDAGRFRPTRGNSNRATESPTQGKAQKAPAEANA